MANYITTKYGTRINVEGLTPEQIARVRSVAEDKGAYGAKGAALAAEIRKRNQTKQPVPSPSGTGTTQTGVPVTTTVENVDLGVKQGTGAIDPKKAVTAVTGAEARDAEASFNMNNPGKQTDALGNEKIVTRDPKTGEVQTTVKSGELGQSAQKFTQSVLSDISTKGNLDLSGAPRILETGDVRLDAQKVGDANYNYMTRNLDRDQRRELEATKQELAQRGIPIDFANPDSMWNKAVGAVNQRYDELRSQANQQAIMGRDASLGAMVGAQSTARDAFVKGAGMEADNARSQLTSALQAVGSTGGDFASYAGGTVDQSTVLTQLLSKMSDAELTKYGIDKDYAAKLKGIAKAGSGGAAKDTSPLFTGETAK